MAIMGLHAFIATLLFAYGSVEVVHSADCEMTVMMPCMTILTSLAGANLQDPTAMCPVLMKAKTCFDNLKSDSNCDVPEQFQGQLNNPEMTAMCAGAASGCTMDAMMKCMGMIPKQPSGQQDGEMDLAAVKAMCSQMQGAMSCLEALTPKCSGNMKTELDKMTANVQQQSASCSSAGCGMKLGECTQMMMQGGAMDTKEPRKHCTTIKAMTDCVKAIPEGTCSGPQQESLDTMMKQIGPMAADKCCPKLVGMYTTCMDKQKEDLLEAEPFKAVDGNCKQMEELYTCSLAFVPECPKEIQEGVTKGKQQVKDNLKQCEGSGYNVTVEYLKKNGNNGQSPLKPAVAVIVSVVMAVVKFYF